MLPPWNSSRPWLSGCCSFLLCLWLVLSCFFILSFPICLLFPYSYFSSAPWGCGGRSCKPLAPEITYILMMISKSVLHLIPLFPICLDFQCNTCTLIWHPPKMTLNQGSFFFFFFFFFLLFRAAPAAYGGSQAKGLIGATAASLRHSHSNAGSEQCLPTYTTAFKAVLALQPTEQGQGSNPQPRGY